MTISRHFVFVIGMRNDLATVFIPGNRIFDRILFIVRVIREFLFGEYVEYSVIAM